MSIVSIVLIVAAIYLVLFCVARLIATVAVWIRLPWVVLLASCIAIIYYLRSFSFLNYIVVVITVAMFVRLLISYLVVFTNRISQNMIHDNREYNRALSKIYAGLFTFLACGTLYANLNYIVLVLLAHTPYEEYKGSSFLNGEAVSLMGFGPIKLVILGVAVVALVRAYANINDFDIDFGDEKVIERPKNTLESYFSGVFGIQIEPEENTLDSAKKALQSKFAQAIPQVGNRDRFINALINVATFELTDPKEIITML